MSEDPLRALDRLLRRQDGVVSRAQAIEVGISGSWIDRRVAAGRWRRVARRVYQVADHAQTQRSRTIAVMLSLGEGATLVGRSAAWWWRLRTSSPGRIEVAVDQARRLRERLDVDLLRRTIAVEDRTVVQGVAVTKKPLTVLDASARLGLVEGARLMDDALLRGAVTLEALRETHMRTAGRHGAPLAGKLLALARGGARSQAERIAHHELRAAGLSGWTANTALTVPGLGRVIADIVFADQRVIVEVDGWAYHRDLRAFRRDAARQNALLAAGWTVIRTNWYELMEEPAVFVATVRRVLTSKISF